ncbi:sporulation histidine kinase inhibitor Sda [Paenibacillus donghaensis]|uniref:Sporulation histidine kinase inhibitor Sda n=1 Tax=Paenibacillus donghaensis TaxID=414771 RepID=A0A2Z2KBY2_9BACL|nr:sporulation histidine kinase inhibitor Sda [Paenibacillus donghaensis]ASA23087.1 hypothetical protein B9T62_21130 [Paenibacillus donghaensis]
MEYHFHPSPRPSSLEMLSDEQLLNIYELAVQVEASPEFIEIVRNVLTSRKVLDVDKR